jgi:hypothetical protein
VPTPLSRDPFARTTLVRDTVVKIRRTSCAWCGLRPGRFTYTVEGDGVTHLRPRTTTAYCSVACYRSNS